MQVTGVLKQREIMKCLGLLTVEILWHHLGVSYDMFCGVVLISELELSGLGEMIT